MANGQPDQLLGAADARGQQIASFLQALQQAQQSQGPGTDTQPEQMSQQGQFNPADVQAQLQGGPAPPFSFAPGTGGAGRQILNALAQGGKAATYVAEDPRERMAENARAQQLWETKQKMSLAAGEFGQREKDRAQQAATSEREFGEREKDRAAQRDIAQMGKETEGRKVDETIRHDKAIEAMKDDPSDKKLDSYVDDKNVQHVVMQRKDNSTYELTYGKVRQPPSGEAKPQLAVDPTGKVITAKPGTQLQPGSQTLSQYGGQPERSEKTMAPYRTILDTYNDSVKLRAMAQAGNASADPDLTVAFFKMIKGAGQGQGIRFTQQEQKLILGARPLIGDAEALMQKVAGSGQKLTPEQRTSMLQVMKVHADAAQREIDRLEGTPGMGAQGQGAAPSQGAGKSQTIRYKWVNNQLVPQ